VVHHDTFAFLVKYQSSHIFSIQFTHPLPCTTIRQLVAKKFQAPSSLFGVFMPEMSKPSNPYKKRPPTAVHTKDDDNVSMRDDSPSSKNSSDTQENEQSADAHNEDLSPRSKSSGDEGNFEDNTFQIPPSFGRPITKETLRNKDHPYVFWASLRMPIPQNPANPMAAVFDALEEFISQMSEEDPQFVVFPYNLSDYESVEDLPPRSKPRKTSPMISMDGWNTSRGLNLDYLGAILTQLY